MYYGKLIEEFAFKARFIKNEYVLNSIYYGGGTPSLAPTWFLEKLTGFLLDNLPLHSKKIEISLEANPETISPSFLKDISAIGINRLSVGVQSMNDHLLVRLERIGSRHNIMQVLGEISNGPIENWNADIIYGIPGQSAADLIYTIQTLISFDPKHISAYELTLHGPSHQNISESQQLEHQEIAWDYLPAHGFHQYEISNFSRPGFECLHNLAVWKYRPYLSLGTSGHSFLDNKRFRTIADIERYLNNPPAVSILQEDSHVIPDLFITTMRLGSFQGNSLYRRLLPAQKYNTWLNILNSFSQNNWIEQSKNGFIITNKGLKFSNTLLEKVYGNLD